MTQPLELQLWSVGGVSLVKTLGLIFVQAMVICALSGVGRVASARDYRPHEGYVDSTLAERGAQTAELQVIDELKPQGPPLEDVIFNEQLTHEFQEKYNDKFGHTNAEQILNSPNRTSYYNDVWFQGTPQDYSEQRHQFANYMMQRLAEWHVDNYMKTNPSARGIYELKEKASSLNVSVSSFQFDMRYEIAGNTADLVVKNPYFKTTKVRLNFNPGVVGPFSAIDQTIFTVGSDITKTISFETFFLMPLNNASFVLTKALAPGLATTMSFLDQQRDLGANPALGLSSQWVRETVYLAGLNYVF